MVLFHAYQHESWSLRCFSLSFHVVLQFRPEFTRWSLARFERRIVSRFSQAVQPVELWTMRPCHGRVARAKVLGTGRGKYKTSAIPRMQYEISPSSDSHETRPGSYTKVFLISLWKKTSGKSLEDERNARKFDFYLNSNFISRYEFSRSFFLSLFFFFSREKQIKYFYSTSTAPRVWILN